jgi:hypothetical protein
VILEEAAHSLFSHIRLQPCGIGLAQVDQDQAIEDVGEILIHVEGCGIGSCGVPRPSLADYVMETEATRGATAAGGC